MFPGYLFPGEQCDGRDSVGVLVAFRYGHLFEEIHLLLAGEEDDFGFAEHHDGVRQLVSKQPCLQDTSKRTVNDPVSLVQVQMNINGPGLTCIAVDLA